jgi:hypothetical protein
MPYLKTHILSLLSGFKHDTLRFHCGYARSRITPPIPFDLLADAASAQDFPAAAVFPGTL